MWRSRVDCFARNVAPVLVRRSRRPAERLDASQLRGTPLEIRRTTLVAAAHGGERQSTGRIHDAATVAANHPLRQRRGVGNPRQHGGDDAIASRTIEAECIRGAGARTREQRPT